MAATILPLAYRSRHAAWAIRNQLLLRATNNHPPRFLEHVHDLQALPKWSAESLMPLAVLPNQAAYHLEHARGRLAFVETWLANEAAFMYHGERPAEDSLFIQDVVSVVKEAQHSLRIAIKEMEKIVPNQALFD